MKSYPLDRFMSPEQKKQNIKTQTLIINKYTVSMKRQRKKPRAAEETVLLAKAMIRDIKRLESEGIIKKNGRKWTLNI